MENDRFQRRGFVPQPKSPTVFVLPGEQIDSAILRWRKGVEKEGIRFEMRRREGYVKPSQRRRTKSMLARRRRRDAQ